MDCFELCEISPKIQCLYCFKYCTEEIVHVALAWFPQNSLEIEKGKIRRIGNPQSRDQKRVHATVLVVVDMKRNENTIKQNMLEKSAQKRVEHF